jgi:hypothetical protein
VAAFRANLSRLIKRKAGRVRARRKTGEKGTEHSVTPVAKVRHAA